LSYFNRLFHRRYGERPSEIRARGFDATRIGDPLYSLRSRRSVPPGPNRDSSQTKSHHRESPKSHKWVSPEEEPKNGRQTGRQDSSHNRRN
jgi:hypothetical protein